ncbi:MAG: alpha/beta fold hydrolase [Bacteroidota bacterium]
MKNIFTAFLILIPLVANAQDAVSNTERFVAHLDAKAFDKAADFFSPEVKAKIDANKLGQIWNTLAIQVGSFLKLDKVQTEEKGDFVVATGLCDFEKSYINLKLTFDKNDQVVGIYFLPGEPKVYYKPASYVDPNLFEEKDIELPVDFGNLPGKIMLPEKESTKKFPIVIFVHGSGSHDMDETIGPNKPFKDLALGLAKYGIASLRYDKKTKAYPEKFLALKDNYTVKDEVIDDAVAAVKYAKSLPNVDPDRIYVLGHSLGATMAPRIAKNAPDAAGIIVMAGYARPLEDLILEQSKYLLGAEGTTDAEQAEISKIEKSVKAVKSKSLSLTTPAETLPLGMSASYWIDLNNFDQLKVASKLKVPILIMQGERDYQVTMEDYNLWQQRLSKKRNVTLKSYPKLNHLFHEGEGESRPKEYSEPNSIPEYIIKDIVRWITK